jgi:hypothetical protein
MAVHKGSQFRFLIIFIAICSSLIVTSHTATHAAAQGQTDITLNAQTGFDGYVKEGKWIPVHITVENKGADLNEASIQVSYKNFSGNASIFGGNVSLPTNSRKELFIYVYYPQGGAASLNVELISDKKVILKTTTRIVNVAPQSCVVGLITGIPSNYSNLCQLTTLSNGVIRLAEIKPSNLPDKPQGWETLDVIVFSDVDSGVLTSAQRSALEVWIAKGGTLITVGGPKWQSTVQGIQEFLPIQVSGTTRASGVPQITFRPELASLPGTAPFAEEAISILATGELSNDASILATQAGIPLVVERKLGAGRSVFFAADPGLAPYKDWVGISTIYNAIIDLKHSQPAWADGKWELGSANQALTTIPELSIPSIFMICGLMALYIVLIGPINYIFLRTFKKREWAWISIPLIVVLVTMLSYIYGYFYRGRNPTLSRLTVIQAWDGVRQAEKDSLLGIYSPQRDTYTLESEDGFLLYPYNIDDINLQSKTSWLSLQDGQHTSVPEIPIEIGGMKVIGTTGITTPLQIDHTLMITFDNGNARISGTITNNSSSTISDLNLVTPARWKVVGDLAPGESAEVNLPLMTTPNSPEFYYGGAVDILQTSYTTLAIDEELRKREAFLRSVITTQNGESNFNWGIYLVGWLEDEDQPSATVAGYRSKISDSTLYIHQAVPAVTLPSGDFKLTTALFEWRANSQDVSPYYVNSYNTDDFTLWFRPAISLTFGSVKQLLLELDSYSQSPTTQVMLWDFMLQDWTILDNVTWGNYDVPNPQNYVSPTGHVILRIRDAQGQGYLEMKRSAITLVVTR